MSHDPLGSRTLGQAWFKTYSQIIISFAKVNSITNINDIIILLYLKTTLNRHSQMVKSLQFKMTHCADNIDTIGL